MSRMTRAKRSPCRTGSRCSMTGGSSSWPRLSNSVVEHRGDLAVVEVAEGRRVVATLAQPLRIGDRASLSIRPERLLLDDTPADNRFSCTVDRLVYLGDVLR